jgi:WD40 repeat protein
LWDFETEALKQTFQGHLEAVCCVKFSADGKQILSGSHDGTIKLWDLGGKIKFEAEHASAISSLEFSPDATQILSSSHDGTAKVWDSGLNIIRTLQAHKNQVNSARFAPKGERIITASHDGTARIWLSPREMYAWIETHTNSIYRLTCDDRKELRTPPGECEQP